MSRPRERRSSAPRIPEASIVGSIPRFEPSGEGWRALEQSYACGFSEQDRAEIRRIVDRYLEWHPFEAAAPLLEDAKAPIDQLEHAARNLNRAFGILFGRSGSEGDAAFYAERAIERAWRGAECLGQKKLLVMNMLSCGLVLACKRAREQSETEARSWQGQAWDKMICNLAQFVAGRGLSIAVRKDTDKQAGVKHSPFVVFVEGIQQQFPAEVPIRFSTGNSLATQISRVLRTAKDNGIDFGRKPEKQIPPGG
jgi:hypothetical protein